MKRKLVPPRVQNLGGAVMDAPPGAGVIEAPPPLRPPDLRMADGAAGLDFRGETLKILFAHRPSAERTRVLGFLRERFDVTVTENIADTLARLSSENWDVAVVEDTLPGIHGNEAPATQRLPSQLARMRGLQENCAIVLLTDRNYSNAGVDGLGAEACFRKPVNIERFLRVLDELGRETN